MPTARSVKRPSPVKRSEFEALRAMVEHNVAVAERNRAEHEVEFRRIADIQLNVDRLGAIVRRLAVICASEVPKARDQRGGVEGG